MLRKRGRKVKGQGHTGTVASEVCRCRRLHVDRAAWVFLVVYDDRTADDLLRAGAVTVMTLT